MKYVAILLILLGFSVVPGVVYAKAIESSFRWSATEKYDTYGYYQRISAKSYGYGFPRKRRASGRHVFVFSPRLRAWAAYDAHGNLIRTGRASGGAHYCRDVRRACLTPRGIFRIHRKGSVHCRSGKFPLGRGGAPMPHCMFFLRAYAIHGSPNVPRANVSHGCIRVLPPAAKWLHQNFIRIGTTVIVTSY